METITKSQYIWMKGFSILPVAGLFLFAIIAFQSNLDQWRFLSLAYIFLGMPHIFGGFIYQFLSLREKGKKHSQVSYVLLFLFLVMFFFWIFGLIENIYFIMFVLSFFLIHAVLNETSIYEEVFGKIDRSLVWPYFLVAQAAVMKSMYSDSIIMYIQEPLIYVSYFGNIYELIEFPMPVFMFIIITLFLLTAALWTVLNTVRSLVKKNTIMGVTHLLTVLPLAALVFFVPEVDHIYLIAFMVLFHVFSWLAFYHVKLNIIRKDKKKNRKHIITRYRWIFWSTHIFFIAVFFIGNFIPYFGTEILYQLFYSNKHYVLVWSLVHIFTSFINETELKKLFYKNN